MPVDDVFRDATDRAGQWFSSASHGLVSLHFIALNHNWQHLSRGVSEYGMKDKPPTIEFLRDAVALLDSAGGPTPMFDALCVIVPGGPIAGTGVRPLGQGLPFQGGEVDRIVTIPVSGLPLSPDNRTGMLRYSSLLFHHELGHVFGLPDLYPGKALGSLPPGGRDTMSHAPPGFELTAWNQAKLGWLASDQMQCVGNGSVTATLSPVETANGLKAIVAPVGASKAYVVESRERRGLDTLLCEEGVLVYSVDTSVDPGSGPMHVVGGGSGNRAWIDAFRPRCGDSSDALFSLQPGRAALFEDPLAGVTIRLVAGALGEQTVEVRKYAPWNDLILDTWAISEQGWAGDPTPITRVVAVSGRAFRAPIGRGIAGFAVAESQPRRARYSCQGHGSD